ncbi:hypothetical protein [Phreatobacter sp.]|uniref:hypothetical protein n=1 Tax=Phreatobacter sp. TaxID=1966341 RepID=UPI003F6E9B7D
MASISRFAAAAGAALLLLASLAPAVAQSGAATRGATAGQAQAPAGTTTPRRPRSAAQLRNDQIMRDCGAEWRRDKARLQAAGKTWRSFLPECRARRRS